MAASDDVEQRVSQLIAELGRDFASLGGELRYTVVRALIHRAVHHASDGPGVDFCALATYLGEMIGHSHKLAHGDNPRAPAHKDSVH